jgi:hypothetical protein
MGELKATAVALLLTLLIRFLPQRAWGLLLARTIFPFQMCPDFLFRQPHRFKLAAGKEGGLIRIMG